MIFYIDGNEVSQAKAKKYFLNGYRATLDWMEDNSTRNKFKPLPNASDIWNKRATKEGREQIFNISAIQDNGGLEIVND